MNRADRTDRASTNSAIANDQTAPTGATPAAAYGDETAPATVDALASLIREARETGAALRFRGSGGWMSAGGPFADARPVSLRALSGVVHYEPGDLVITLGAGTTLGELDAVVRAHGQTFALAPYGGDDATIGACVATAAAAPLALGDFVMRDLVLGVRSVTGTGEAVVAGGRVVKNVAGFDLVRLHTGAWGTLGPLTEITVRLHAIAPVDATLVGTLERDLAAALPALIANRAPLPMIVRAAPGRAPELWARVSGNTARADALTARLLALGVTAVSHVAGTGPLRVETGAIALRARAARSDAVPVIAAAQQAFPEATWHYDPARGSLRLFLPASSAPTLYAAIARFLTTAASGGAQRAVSVVLDDGRVLVGEPARTRSPLEQGIKQALDPDDLCNRLASPEVSSPRSPATPTPRSTPHSTPSSS